MRRTLWLMAVLATLSAGSLAPTGARAATCSNAAILSRTGVADAGVAFDLNAVACGQEAYDTRLIQPGATQVVLRYASVPQPALNGPSLCGDLDGLATFSHTKVLLKPTSIVAGIVVYQSDWMPLQPVVFGTLTGTIYPLSACPVGLSAQVAVPAPIASTTYHTVL